MKTAKEIIKEVMALYKRFCAENSRQWKSDWREYLRKHYYKKEE